MNSIFIQIASYRDPQLIPTIEDAIKNAKFPYNLAFGVCNQFHPKDTFGDLSQFKGDKRFKIINFDVSKSTSNGVCWARHSVQQLYNNEKYTLQLDSHMRFVQDWDVSLIQMLKELQKKGHKKPLITTYAPSFNPDNDPAEREDSPWEMTFDRFTPEGVVFFLPRTIPDWEKTNSPVPARFYSAHFAFTVGEFSEEVQHDPDFYFHGEEISIAVRAFTHGYDLFHPNKVIIWHEYTRKGRTKHWDDDKNWGKKNSNCHSLNRKLLGIDNEHGYTGKYGLGKTRTLKQYEEYAGIRFRDRSVSQYTLDNQYPPNPDNDVYKKIFRHCIDVNTEDVPLDDYDFWATAFHSTSGETIFRKDVKDAELSSIVNKKGEFVNIWREFIPKENPAYWVVWPHSLSKGWCEKITGTL